MSTVLEDELRIMIDELIAENVSLRRAREQAETEREYWRKMWLTSLVKDCEKEFAARRSVKRIRRVRAV